MNTHSQALNCARVLYGETHEITLKMGEELTVINATNFKAEAVGSQIHSRESGAVLHQLIFGYFGGWPASCGDAARQAAPELN